MTESSRDKLRRLAAEILGEVKESRTKEELEKKKKEEEEKKKEEEEKKKKNSSRDKLRRLAADVLAEVHKRSEEKPPEVDPYKVAKDWYERGVNAESLEGSIACFKMVVLVDPDHVDAHGRLADIYLERGREREALKYLKEVNRLRKKGKEEPLEKKVKVSDEEIIKALLDEAEKLKGNKYGK